MIDYLKGTVSFVEPDYAVVEVNDIGYRVFTPNPYLLEALPQPITVHIHHHVREDAIQLFGFDSREQKRLFRKLLDVTGIGPRVALGILSAGKPEQLVSAIQQENMSYLTKLPGIGKKTAQRIVIELKEKLSDVGIDIYSDSSQRFALQYEDELGGAADGDDEWKEAKDGLKALGYTDTELDRAWASLRDKVDPNEPVDSLMKKALQQLFKG